ncbi:hypothetical protein HMPREF9696_02259 [Afipia clevelandensis ATCC 49720]|uniref:Uncharacterized protein n=1 Tax=Afipia clevelandensis ATCC 49720 TaxID=883079 RepID=K8P0B6_9BRAD|nr:hypothetical protein HMPREF9696_02259 [Afipia clevelandensis ATCC 49720]
MESPDDNPSKATIRHLKCNKVADAGFVHASAIVYDKDVAFLRCLKRFQKDVDASNVTCGQDTPRAFHTLADRS